MNEENKDEQLLRITQHIETLQIQANNVLKEFGIQHPNVLKSYRLLNEAIVSYQIRRMGIFKSWLREAAGKKRVKLPTRQEDVLRYIHELRRRLIVITELYGLKSAKTLMYSQYIDKFIVEYQKSEREQSVLLCKK